MMVLARNLIMLLEFIFVSLFGLRAALIILLFEAYLIQFRTPKKCCNGHCMSHILQSPMKELFRSIFHTYSKKEEKSFLQKAEE